ncbi:MAG: fibronectin type III domain-containing protein [Bacteroidales bacterium]|jgi:hypothetical protein|nr:fibronectin type III domain-containing protein [Bacteroidales bacterium]
MKNTFFTLLLVIISFTTMAQWESDPAINNRITPQNFPIYDSKMIATDQATYIAFNSPLPGPIGYYFQILNNDGEKIFPDPGLLLCSESNITFTVVNDFLYVDDDGNAIVTVADTRYDGANLNYTVYKIAPDGMMLWGENGLQLVSNTGYAGANIAITQLDNGNYVFAWQNMSNSLVYIKCLANDGTQVWAEQSISTTLCSYPFLINAKNDEFILIFSQRNGSGMPWSRYSHLKCRKYNGDGSAAWTNDVTIYTGGYTIPALAGIFDVQADLQGGFFIGWYDAHAVTNREDAYVAHILNDGTSAFPEMALRIGNSSIYRAFRPKISPDTYTNNFYVSWQESNASQSYKRQLIQKLSYSGVEQWTEGGLLIDEANTPSNLEFSSVQSTDNNRCALFYMKSTGYTSVDSYISLFNGDGTYAWEQEKINFTTSPYWRSSLNSSRYINNSYWLAMWDDNRGYSSLDDKSLFVQRINLNGSLGENVLIPCDAPTNNLVSNISFTSAHVYWLGNTTSYIFEYKTGNEEWISQNVITNGLTNEIELTDLLQGTQYVYRIKSICPFGEQSEWIEGEFTTAVNALNELTTNSLHVYYADNSIKINNSDHKWIESVKIYNATGSLLSTTVAHHHNNLSIPVTKVTAMVFVVISEKDNKVYTAKVVIQ